MATEDLAAQFDFMNSVVQTPRDFGLRVASHPTLEITSRNKMRTGQEFKRDFSCKLSQTRVLILMESSMTETLKPLKISCTQLKAAV